MLRVHARTIACLLLLAGCSAEELPPGHFPCGDRGGSCDESELCIVDEDDGCSTCVPLPETCEGDASCDCIPPGNEPAWETYECANAGVCTADDGGRTLMCKAVNWGCG